MRDIQAGCSGRKRRQLIEFSPSRIAVMRSMDLDNSRVTRTSGGYSISTYDA